MKKIIFGICGAYLIYIGIKNMQGDIFLIGNILFVFILHVQFKKIQRDREKREAEKQDWLNQNTKQL